MAEKNVDLSHIEYVSDIEQKDIEQILLEDDTKVILKTKIFVIQDNQWETECS
ncbi:MAG: hypothetical protein IT281_00715 [Ignavibacteria bacterium]|nr:hypothetical protein [Ignavibacteria bacterium]MCC7158040.1 hypothetical protein [Ignavibacteria bacterium]